ncbi:Helicase sen1 [Schizosaccharomyces pombe]|uniref:Helicase sen1 n=1 Tax=Schizosaccharomyces pombe (strain 972 / ATCC 24843) TaxID=284812 RepID=SEN1_SCHPO|nr:helicase Sen1 [Schizosaccharomyces pombe]Q92355.1 RecName: Full=Helicase sen1 [Schizosaccharomyces pombe 972h-]CAB03612.1 ATP-dependent 5' to 3' DNA/RNA helicase Sen1 [Schizosaccharomyces pombe]|eukprot:NP_594119.1 helicase Sen1 [Schizosaccharomyces pombe]
MAENLSDQDCFEKLSSSKEGQHWFCSGLLTQYIQPTFFWFAHDETPSFKWVLNAYHERLRSCTSCIQAYYELRNESLAKGSYSFTGFSITDLQEKWNKWDIIRVLEDFKALEDETIDFTSLPCLIFETLLNPKLFTCKNIYKNAIDAFNGLLSDWCSNIFLPGYLLFFYEASHPDVLEWVHSFFKENTEIRISSATVDAVFNTVVFESQNSSDSDCNFVSISSPEFWERTYMFLELLPLQSITAACESILKDYLLNLVKTSESLSSQQMSCLRICCNSSSFWSAADSFKEVSSFLKNLLKNVTATPFEVSDMNWAYIIASFFRTCLNDFVSVFPEWLKGFVEEKRTIGFIIYSVLDALFDLLSLDYSSPSFLNNTLSLMNANSITILQDYPEYMLKLRLHSLLYDIAFISWSHKAITKNPSFVFDPSYELSPFWKLDNLQEEKISDVLFSKISSCCFAHDIEISENSTPSGTMVQFAELWQVMSEYISGFLKGFSEKSSTEISNMLGDSSKFDTVVSFLLSPTQPLYVSAFHIVQIITNCTKNRNEALKKLVAMDFRGIVHGLADAVLNWQSILSFFPALRIMRFLSITNKSLSSDNSAFTENDIPTLGAYWQCIWNILDLVFSNVARWSLNNPADTVKALMKLTLKFVDDLFQNDGIFIKLLAKFDSLILLGETSESLFSFIMWLKINDLELRGIVINSLCKLFTKFSNFDYLFEDRTVTFLTDFIIRKQKAHLSADQCKQLANVLTQASPEAKTVLEQHRLSEMRKTKKQTELTNSAHVIKPSPTPQITVKQNTTKSSSAPRMGMLEQLKQEYLTKRNFESKLKSSAVSSRKPTFNEVKPANLLAEDLSDNEDDIDRKQGLFSLAKANKIPEIRQQERRQVQLLSNSTIKMHPSQIRMMTNRNVANVKARLFPSMTDFYKEILSWEPANQSPNPVLKFHKLDGKIIDSFKTVEHYMEVLQPMIFMECWSQIQSTKLDLKFSPVEGIMVERTAVNNFVDIGVSVAPKDLYGYPLYDTEVVSLAFNKEDASSMKGLCCFAKVERIVRQTNGVLVVLRTLPSMEILNKLQGNCALWFLKLTNLATFTRQYAGIRGLPYFHLADDIIRARPCSQPVKHSSSEIKAAMKRYQVNEPQAKAIMCALDNNGFTLIQGPPGTGKTKTIIGIISALLVDLSRYHITRPNQQSKSTESKQQILLCAPSNAAVDEVLLRLKRGFLLENGEKYIPRVVRIGNPETINVSVRDLSLEYQTEKQLLEVNQGAIDLGSLQELTRWRDTFYDCIQKIEELEKQIDVARDVAEDTKSLGKELQNKINEKNLAEQKVEELQSQSFTKNKEVDLLRKKAQKAILKQADVVCATLSGSGHDLVAHSSLNFSTVIIDEAAQAVELDTIIPLRYGAKKCILVGDPNQLPPTVLSKKAASLNYSQSLFVRIQKNFSNQMCLLSIQYRMHPDISHFPSKKFYDSRLEDGDNMAEKTQQVWHVNPKFTQYRLFDVRGKERTSNTMSTYNLEEVEYLVNMVDELLNKFPDVNFTGRIGVITPYRSQLHELRRAFKVKYGKSFMSTIDIQTVDGFQGQEKDIIFFSCVKSYSKHGIGFLRDFRRLNVALTRARSSLLIIGNMETLKTDDLWGSLVDDALSRKLVESPHIDSEGRLITISRTSEKRMKNEEFVEPPSKKLANSEPSKEIRQRS